RWAQATTCLGNMLFVHGGLSDPYDSYSYTSAPAVSDLLSLDLSTSFGISAPPWNLLSSSSSPALAWHTLSAFNTTNILLFGGQPGPDSQTVLTTLNDSAALLSVASVTNPNFSIEPENWASEPMRRTHHAASTVDGRVYIIGGEKADGSGNAFSEHYVFDPSTAEFSPLPSSANSPPNIYGHTSLVLSDGRLVALGGYCASCGQLVPFNTIWSLDTTGGNLNWELLVVSTTSLPIPRREFAAVSLPDGNILIHGGADAVLQQTYSDGWILDTGAVPMTWKSVEALSQVGARKNHFAVQAGGLVLFGFGYGSSAPASASIFIYDPASSTMASMYSAPSGSASTHQSFSHPTQTGSSGPFGSGTAGSSGTTPGNAPPQMTSSYPLGSKKTASGAGSSQTLAIALGTTFGFLGLVSGVVIVYFVKRKRGRNAPGNFVLLRADLEDKGGDAGSTNGVVTTAGDNSTTLLGARTFRNVLVHIGLSRGHMDQRRPRRDMFADEDARSFTWGAPLTIPQREGSDATSAWSLRSVGAMVRGMMSREPSASGTCGDRSDWLSRTAGDRDELIASEKGKRIRDGSRGRSGAEGIYADPFADPQTGDDYSWLDLRPGILQRDEEYDGPVGLNTPLEEYDLMPAPSPKIPSIAFPLRTLGPLKQVTHTPTLNQSSSLRAPPEPSHDNPPSPASQLEAPVSPATSHSFHAPSLENSSYDLSPLKPNLPLSQPVHRSNSWWARFAKTSFLDRRGSFTSSKPLVFRDPNPAPPLSIIEEASTSKDGVELHGGTPPKGQHTRSIASSHSMRTANTESAEQLGGSYDVVQR
ncbi:hypothetical protein EDC04DRAFT_2506759, partial [Pisolithus marmoratus]